ncbi:MAG: SAM-dependent methyltransferase, partial [Acaryochloridaceae cyanobacterium RU_4_10]|nr:SAM-dependent methyltransferase [Acaryochloridaceae cyanobacterium RU_4_10]
DVFVAAIAFRQRGQRNQILLFHKFFLMVSYLAANDSCRAAGQVAKKFDALLGDSNAHRIFQRAFLHGFDFVLEHTCFCAIPATLRSQYVRVVRSLLKPNGQLIALFFTHNKEGGPPFGVKPQEILNYFTPHFDRILFQPAKDSIARRKGEEHLAIFQANLS